MSELERCLASTGAAVRSLFERALRGNELSAEDATLLLGVTGTDLDALCLTADALRQEQAGERVTYVVNRNINFTNVCVKACKFCAFSRTHRSEEGYFLGPDEVVRRAVEARDLGATEVCIQAGLAPQVEGRFYIDLCRAVKQAAPELHVHAFSPEEIKFGAGLAGMSFREYLLELQAAGLGSVPGTSAEILDDVVRKRLAGGRITTSEWVEVIRTAHAIGLPTTSTVMFGHVESPRHLADHLVLLRSIQAETGGFTEFVPLSFVYQEAPLYRKQLLPDARQGPTGNDVVRLFAVARLLLGKTFVNIQASWVKEGLRQAQRLLSAGANDLGGTLVNESISTSAGSGHGQRVSPAELRRVIRDAGRLPAERTTLYRVLREYGAEPSEDDGHPLDRVRDADARFGSYTALTRDPRFRYVGS